MELTYINYLKINELTALQELQSNPAEHDEMLFIIIHQSYELWFKQILHEIDYLNKLLAKNDITSAQKTLKRILTILKVLVHQVDILETMTPLEFLSFRDYLKSASGFQSAQFRELEFVLGYKQSAVLGRFEKDSPEKLKLEKRFKEKTVWDYFLSCLRDNSYPIPEELINRNFEHIVEPSADVQNILIEVYAKSNTLAQFCELLLDLDEGIQEWRYRHVKMVERTIGSKPGTGGSPGVDYLKTTLFKSVFPDLWAIRSELKKNV